MSIDAKNTDHQVLWMFPPSVVSMQCTASARRAFRRVRSDPCPACKRLPMDSGMLSMQKHSNMRDPTTSCHIKHWPSKLTAAQVLQNVLQGQAAADQHHSAWWQLAMSHQLAWPTDPQRRPCASFPGLHSLCLLPNQPPCATQLSERYAINYKCVAEIATDAKPCAAYLNSCRLLQ